MRLYRCSFRPRAQPEPGRARPPESVLVEAETAAVAERLLAAYAALRGCEVARVLPVAPATAAA